MTTKTKSVFQLFGGLTLAVISLIVLFANAPKHGDPLTPALLILISVLDLTMLFGIFLCVKASLNGGLDWLSEKARQDAAKINLHRNEY